jgi:chitodextrinase
VQFRSAVTALIVLLLAAFPAGAQARAWTIGYDPDSPAAGDTVTFQADRTNPGNGSGESLRWDFGDGGTGATANATHVYQAAGEYTVTLTTLESDSSVTVEDSRVVQVGPAPPPPNTPPSAAFTFSPISPIVGEQVLFEGGGDPDGDPITRQWNFGDLSPVSSDAAPTHAYAAAGSYTVSLSVSDDRGGFASTSRDVTVSPPAATPPPEPPPADSGTGTQDTGTPIAPPQPQPKPLTPMRPFPVVRIAGVVLPHGALVRILSVRAPRGAHILVKCRGRSCPVSAVARSSVTSLVRIHRFERRLSVGVRLELFVRRGRRIGKYTRFAIRAGKPPARVDRCLMPGGNRPVRCP